MEDATASASAVESRPVSDAALLSLVARRLETHPLPGRAVDLVLAAFRGREAVEATLRGDPLPAQPQGDRTKAQGSAAAYLASIEVEGFRGIGAKATLHLHPGPGLTLVLGRNGSGKSSFSEALEMLLLGSNRRWEDRRTKVWKDGWQNLHHRHTAIEARFAIDGRREQLTLTRRWADGAGLDNSQLLIGAKPRTLDSIGWSQPLAAYPPLLSHHELESALDEGPSHLYDALARILGLGDLTAAQESLRQTRLELERAGKAAREAAAPLRSLLERTEDERAGPVLRALQPKVWDLDVIAEAVTGLAAADERSTLRRLGDLANLPVLSREALEQEIVTLRDADGALRRLQEGETARADEMAALLEQALAVHTHATDQTCPVCGSEGALTYDWRLRTSRRLEELRSHANALRDSRRALESAVTHASQLVTAVPLALREPGDTRVPTSLATQAWQRWADVPEGRDAQRLAAHLEANGPLLLAAVAEVRRTALAELERRERSWRPVADAIIDWLPRARAARESDGSAEALKAAETWLRAAHDELRDERFQPIAQAVQANWTELRQDSNVTLGELRLTGASTQRRLALEVRVDGEPGSALGVMSQGELNCLALSLFLPRAAMPESPFRFVVIDDPVQAMDPAKVEGLATMLARAARERQVVVLTHDTRLSDAVRFLRLPATVIEVERREGSAVELREVDSPARRSIHDAMAVAQTEGLPTDAVRVVAGFCRMALEAAAAEAATRRMRGQGKRFAEVEAELQRPTTLFMWLALGLFGDPARSGDVTAHLQRQHPWAVDTVHICNRGAHGARLAANPVDFVGAVERLVAVICPPEPSHV
jgi:energy-coupling factor transporter ATP-binding protein EcfA2